MDRTGHFDRLSILVSSCDSYADCWDPFFTLFSRYAGWHRPVHLVSERLGYRHPAVEVRALCVADDDPADRRLTWSQATARALACISTPWLLWLQEDYFLRAPADPGRLSALISTAEAHGLDHVNLVCNPVTLDCPYPHLREIGQRAPHRLSLQAGLWRRDLLASLLRAHESPWQFEVFGSRRSWRHNHRLFCVDDTWDAQAATAVWPYDLTGIVRGRWSQPVVEDLFRREGLAVDFTRRGFHDPLAPPQPRRSLWQRGWDRLRSLI